jgi:hypothetical protein
MAPRALPGPLDEADPERVERLREGYDDPLGALDPDGDDDAGESAGRDP